jgi:hypothetical protein
MYSRGIIPPPSYIGLLQDRSVQASSAFSPFGSQKNPSLAHPQLETILLPQFISSPVHVSLQVGNGTQTFLGRALSAKHIQHVTLSSCFLLISLHWKAPKFSHLFFVVGDFLHFALSSPQQTMDVEVARSVVIISAFRIVEPP